MDKSLALDTLRGKIRDMLRVDETEIVPNSLCDKARFSVAQQAGILDRARPLVQSVREHRLKSSGIDAFLKTYDLSSREGIVLMCIAEALLRIPDAETMDRLIHTTKSVPPIGRSSGRVPQPVRQCLDLGPDADGPHRQSGAEKPR